MILFRQESRSRKSAQGDKWSFCLTAGKIGPRIRRDEEQTSTPAPHTGFQGEGGLGPHQGRPNAGPTGRAVDVHPNQITSWKAQLEGGAADVFGSGGGPGASTPAIDVKSLYAKIGELTLENDLLEGALNQGGFAEQSDDRPRARSAAHQAGRGTAYQP